ncbi:MAG TPA: tetratricopeptide repeat protein [Opitutaceae bacterium]|nr:tetratricopeptide repeat protein [Opitutaceae bacterium]
MSEQRPVSASRFASWSEASGQHALLIAGVAVAVYLNTLSAPFVFDDRRAIVDNPTIRSWATALFPPLDAAGASGRPIVNLSLALNYALGGLAVRGYHVFNLLIHAAAALTLYGLVARTLRLPRFVACWGASARTVALAIAALWAAHPLLTESVTCVVQRSESLASLFYLLTLYAFVRGASGDSRRWFVASGAACFVGVATKEMVATAPLVVWLYDACFVSDGAVAAWRRRAGFYFALALSWVPLGWLVLGANGRGGTVGFGFGVGSWHYALTQCEAVARYLALSVWPHPLVVDYGEGVVERLASVWPQALAIVAALAFVGRVLARRQAIGFLGASFFLILAPSSSFLPLTTQTIAEHRMYLPLAALVTSATIAAHVALGRRAWMALTAVAAALGLMAIARNETYRSERALWADTVAHRPDNARAHYNLAVAELALAQTTEAERELREALRLAPDYTDAYANLGQLLIHTRRPVEAVPLLEQAVTRRPEFFAAQLNLATALAATGRAREAVAHYEIAARLQPAAAIAQFGLGTTRAALGDFSAAAQALREVVRLEPQNAAAHATLATALAAGGEGSEARGHFETALQLDPNGAETHFNFGLLLAHAGELARAQEEWERALALRPDYADARAALQQVSAATAGRAK